MSADWAWLARAMTRSNAAFSENRPKNGRGLLRIGALSGCMSGDWAWLTRRNEEEQLLLDRELSKAFIYFRRKYVVATSTINALLFVKSVKTA